MRHCVWSRNLKNEEAIAHVGPQRHQKKKILPGMCSNFPTDIMMVSLFSWHYLREESRELLVYCTDIVRMAKADERVDKQTGLDISFSAPRENKYRHYTIGVFELSKR